VLRFTHSALDIGRPPRLSRHAFSRLEQDGGQDWNENPSTRPNCGDLRSATSTGSTCRDQSNILALSSATSRTPGRQNSDRLLGRSYCSARTHGPLNSSFERVLCTPSHSMIASKAETWSKMSSESRQTLSLLNLYSLKDG